MCLILFSYKQHPHYRLILAANRDEFYDRPTAEVHFWEDDSNILAGKDLQEGGTWLGVTRTGRFAAITNYRDPSLRKDQAVSRGFLVSDYLRSDVHAQSYIERIRGAIGSYNDFNLLLGDPENIYYLSSHPSRSQVLTEGAYGLSNHLLNTPWPKIEKGATALTETIADPGGFTVEELLEILSDDTRPEDQNLPDTGVGLEWERILGPIFIKSDVYGTRSSTILLIDYSGRITLVERSHDPGGSGNGEDRRFELT